MKPGFRMYVDENGNASLGASNNPNHRYLALTGVICSLDHVATTVAPQLEALKAKYFGAHPDEPVVLHRSELVNRRPPFETLNDPQLEAAFNKELLGLLNAWDYTVITAVIDKLEHRNRYVVWQYDPYHYCLEVLMERFVMWLHQRDGVGDVLAESRGGDFDIRLKNAFNTLWTNGTTWVKSAQTQRRLTSRQLKVKPKANNVPGLQIADLVSHGSFRAILAAHINGPTPVTFGAEIVKILEASKYRRSALGVIDGYGRKWLP